MQLNECIVCGCFKNRLSNKVRIILCCVQVFECVMSWVSGDLANREQYLAELMEYVRLPLLSQDYLIQRVEEEPLLKQDAQCMYLLCMSYTSYEYFK